MNIFKKLVLLFFLLNTLSITAEAKPKKPVSVFNYYGPSKIPWHNRYKNSLSLPSRGGSPRQRFKLLNPKKFKRIRKLTMISTGYILSPKMNSGYTTTATGLGVKKGAVAVDPRVIPLGTYLYVEGYGYAFACDVGGDIKNNRIDLVFPTYKEAIQHGRRRVKVWILK